MRIYVRIRACDEGVYVGLLAASKFVTNRELYLTRARMHASRSPSPRENLEKPDDGFESYNHTFF